MARDPIDTVYAQWGDQRPDLDTGGLEVVSRILILSKELRKSAKRDLSGLGVDLWAFEVLAALRRQGKPYRMNPTELSRSVVLSSGAMTNRLDRLEMAGLVERRPDPDDRRAILIELTKAGFEMVEKGIRVRADATNRIVAVLEDGEREALVAALRKLLAPRLE